jgi:addiction module HigA family antidote
MGKRLITAMKEVVAHVEGKVALPNAILTEKAMRMLNPVHPGRFLRTEIIQAHDLSVTEAAKILRVLRPTLSSLLNAKADLSGDMALRFEKAFGVDMDTLMRMQNSYDIARTRSRQNKIRVERYEPLPAA